MKVNLALLISQEKSTAGGLTEGGGRTSPASPETGFAASQKILCQASDTMKYAHLPFRLGGGIAQAIG